MTGYNTCARRWSDPHISWLYSGVFHVATMYVAQFNQFIGYFTASKSLYTYDFS